MWIGVWIGGLDRGSDRGFDRGSDRGLDTIPHSLRGGGGSAKAPEIDFGLLFKGFGNGGSDK